MAVSLIKKNYETNVCVFCYDIWETDKDKLPTLNSKGKDKLSTIYSCAQGSIAKGINGKNYILSGDNTWVLYTSVSTGEGSGSGSGDDSIKLVYNDGTTIDNAELYFETFNI